MTTNGKLTCHTSIAKIVYLKQIILVWFDAALHFSLSSERVWCRIQTWGKALIAGRLVALWSYFPTLWKSWTTRIAVHCVLKLSHFSQNHKVFGLNRLFLTRSSPLSKVFHRQRNYVTIKHQTMLKHFWMISVKHILLQNILKPDRQSCEYTAVFRYKDIFNASSCLTDVNLSFALVQARGYQHSTSSFDCCVRDKRVDYLVYTAKSTYDSHKRLTTYLWTIMHFGGDFLFVIRQTNSR